MGIESHESMQEIFQRMREIASEYNIVVVTPTAPPMAHAPVVPQNDVVIIDYITLL